MNWDKLNKNISNCFFGYYDRNPWNNEKTRHLALHCDVQDRVPIPGEMAQVGYLERTTGKFITCAETRAWGHQQGSMLQWLKHLPNTFIFNDYDLKKRQLVCCIYQIGQGIIGYYNRPIYIVSSDGNWGLSLNFSRLVRRGYSYADAPVPVEYLPDLDADGLFLVDMISGHSQLLKSYREIINCHPMQYSLADRYLWLDHPGFNCDSSQMLFLFRDCADPFHPTSWHTNMFTMNVDGTNLRCTLPDAYWGQKITHQLWGRTPNEIVVDANWQEKGSEYVVFDHRLMPPFATRISTGLGHSGHLVFSPDRQWLLADTYPDKNGKQLLAVVNLKTEKLHLIGEFNHVQPIGTCIDVRCDLHPRWSNDGSIITVDSIHNGTRDIYISEFNPAALN